MATGTGDEADTARDALSLLVRLAHGQGAGTSQGQGAGTSQGQGPGTAQGQGAGA
jgi:hypothetical protein